MKKLLLSMLLAVGICASMVPNSARARENKFFDPHNNQGSDNTATTIVISKDADFSSWNTTDVYPNVKEISFEEGTEGLDDYTFYYFPNVEKITFPSSLTAMNGAFNPSVNYELKDKYAFLTKLNTIEVSPENINYASLDGVLYSRDYTTLFWYPQEKKDSTFVMPEFVTEIGYQAFGSNPHLKKFIIGTRFEWDNFYYRNDSFLPNLKEFEVPEDCYSMTVVDGILFNKNKTTLYCYPSGKEGTEYKIPDTVVHLDNYSFSNTSIKKLELSAKLDEPYQLESALRSEFEEIIVPEENEFLSSVDGVVYNKTKDTFLYWPKGKRVEELTFPSTLKFMDLSNITCIEQITKLTIPKAMDNLFASSKMSALMTIEVDSGNEFFTVVDGLLYSSDKKQLFIIPAKFSKSTLTVPAEFLYYDYSLSELEFPSVTSIIVEGSGSNFCYQCFPNLKEFQLSRGNKKAKVVNQVLYNASQKTLVWYPQAKKDTTFSVPSSVTKLNDLVFMKQKYLQNVTLPKKLKTFDDDCLFWGCKKLKKITVVSGNTALKSVNGVLYTKDMKTLLCYPAAKTDKKLQIPDSVEIMYTGNYYMNLTSLSFGKNFRGFYDWYEGYVPTYARFPKVTTIKVSSKNKNCYAIDNVLYSKLYSEGEITLYPLAKNNKTYVIPKGITYMPYNDMLIKNTFLKNVTCSDEDLTSFAKTIEYHGYYY